MRGAISRKRGRGGEVKPSVEVEVKMLEMEEEDEASSGAESASSSELEDSEASSGSEMEAAPVNLAEESDSEGDEGDANRIGNVPLWWYDEYKHIGYGVTGKPFMKKEAKDRLDALLDRFENAAQRKRVLWDEVNQREVELSKEDLTLLNRIRRGQFPHKSFNPYEELVPSSALDPPQREAFGNMVEPKSRFVPSKWEAKLVLRLINAIRNGWIRDPNAPIAKEEERVYELWAPDARDAPARKGPPVIAAPRALMPTHAESYNPPKEYVPTEEEKAAWELLEPDERPDNYITTSYDSLRAVPGYENFIRERFHRCLDLYLCPRIRRKRLDIEPDSLIPRLPTPSQLRPFPQALAVEYFGLHGKANSVSVSPCGQWVAAGSNDKTVRIWEVTTGRAVKQYRFENFVTLVVWHPSLPILVATAGHAVHLLLTNTGSVSASAAAHALLFSAEHSTSSIWHVHAEPTAEGSALDGEAEESGSEDEEEHRDAPIAGRLLAAGCPSEPGAVEEEEEIVEGCGEDEVSRRDRVVLTVGERVVDVQWQKKGDYFATVSCRPGIRCVLIHRASVRSTHAPFAKSTGLVQRVAFHPSKPLFFVATKQSLRVWDLKQTTLVKKFRTPMRHISSLSVHRQGDNILVSSYDRQVCWFDLDLGDKPYKTLQYHTQAVRGVRFHPGGYPLFASCGDDGLVHVFHGRVYNDLLTNPLIVPVKVLKAHPVKQNLGCLALAWHPSQPFVFSAGADGVVRMFAP